MSELDIIRAWKDKTYRNSLSADELALLPEHPAGAIELTNDELANVEGGITYGCSTLSLTSGISIIISVVTSAVYVSYQLGTGGTNVSCCPCPPPPAR